MLILSKEQIFALIDARVADYYLEIMTAYNVESQQELSTKINDMKTQFADED